MIGIQSKLIIAIIAVAAIAVAGTAVAIAATGNEDDSGNSSSGYTINDSDGIRLKILGNADGSDAIDSGDIEVINSIIAANSDGDTTNDIDWKTEYPYADADYDGDIDEDDSAVVQQFIDKESCRMYYLNYYNNVTYVNYPIGQKIGAEYLVLQILPAIHS